LGARGLKAWLDEFGRRNGRYAKTTEILAALPDLEPAVVAAMEELALRGHIRLAMIDHEMAYATLDGGAAE
jgi:hypothetical protein